MLSLKLKHLAKNKSSSVSKTQLSVILNTITNPISPSSSSPPPYGGNGTGSAISTPWLASRSTTTSQVSNDGISYYGRLSMDPVVVSLKEWFKTRNNNALFYEIFKIIGSNRNEGDDVSFRITDLALSNLRIHLDESFVLDVLNYGKYKDVLSCLKFFDWAGRQPGFVHTRATFHAIFGILSRAKLFSLMLDFLDSYIKQRYVHRVRFHNTLVMGYAVAGKPQVALQLFGRMRFQGLDLDAFGYHVLLNALVEMECFDAVKVIAKQIEMRGFESELTWSVMVKNFCKQKLFEEAGAYLRGLVSDGRSLKGDELGGLVTSLCKDGKFEQAEKLIEEFKDTETVPMTKSYDAWVMNLVWAGRQDEALEFMKKQKFLDGYVPDLFRYNSLICKLLRENRLKDVFDLLMEMKESELSPDDVTMNAALCFFCKAGMVDAAVELYNARSEYGLTLNSMAYNFLINTLCLDGSTDKAFGVLQDSAEQGYFPGKKAISILADAFCREGKLDKMKELLLIALERNVKPSASTYGKFISALCAANRVEDGYLIYEELNKINEVATRSTFFDLIHGFNRLDRGDVAAKLVIEMQEKGYKPSRTLFRAVVRSLSRMQEPETQFLELLKLQMSCSDPSCTIYNFFIEGAGYAKKPELARGVYEMMMKCGIKPNLQSDIIMLQSYLKSEKILDAVNFFNSLRTSRVLGRKLYAVMVAGLCKANKVDLALEFLMEMKTAKVTPSMECYELLIKSLCLNGRYDAVVILIDDLEKTGRSITPFIGNTLLLYSFQSQELYEAWTRLKEDQAEKSDTSMLRLLIGAFCGRVRVSEQVEHLEEVIGNCFTPNVFTYNMLLRRICSINMDSACELFLRMCQNGYVPDQFTFDILVQGFSRHGRTKEAHRWLEEMLRRGFTPAESTTKLM
ncbi:hypothetical protein CsatA_020730 [Cannabis sativa]